MTYRPYPSVDRARHQLDRHAEEVPPTSGRPLRFASPSTEQMFRGFVDAMRQVRVVMPPMKLRTDAERSACGVHISVIRAAEWRARNS